MADETTLGNHQIHENFKAINAKDTSLNWFIFVHSGHGWEADGHGNGGLVEVRNHLRNDAIQYVVIRVEAVDVEYGVHTARPKVVLVTWIGPDVSGIKRRTVLGQKEEVRSALKGVGVHFEFDDIESFSISRLGEILSASQGAHKPTYYKFGDATWDLPAHA